MPETNHINSYMCVYAENQPHQLIHVCAMWLIAEAAAKNGKVKDPDAPKRALSAFMIFAQKVRIPS
jgi:hypothetical protein